MKLLIAVDSFKGSASSYELGEALQKGILSVLKKNDSVAFLPISDGGEGALEALSYGRNVKKYAVDTQNSFGKPISAEYLIFEDQGKRIAVIESAQVVGLHYNKRPNDGYFGTSYGLGKVLLDAKEKGMDELILTLGGSGTTDGGLGLLQSLGSVIYNAQGQPVASDKNPLLAFESLQLNAAKKVFQSVKITVASDVTNGYAGPSGAAAIFGAQKGLTSEQIDFLNQKMLQVAQQLKKTQFVDIAQLSGSGAAGGLGGALALLGAEIVSGMALIGDLIGLEEAIQQADVILTGEGKIDRQSAHGKVLAGICKLAQKHQKPVIAICGAKEAPLGPFETAFLGIFSIQTKPLSLEEAMQKETTIQNCQSLAKTIYQLLKYTEA